MTALLLLIASALWPLCGSAAAQVFQPIAEPYQHVFPALVLAKLDMGKRTTPHRFGVKLSQTLQTDARIEMNLDGLASAQLMLPKASKPGTYWLEARWQIQALRTISSAKTMPARFRWYQQNALVSEQTIALQVHASNEVLLGIEAGGQKKAVDFNWLLASFVDEQSPAAGSLINLATQSSLVQRFDAYAAGSDEEVYAQVFALWHSLQTRGMRYSNITPKNRTHPALLSQPVRTLATSWRSKKANCVDGTVLLASTLQRIGLKSALVILPGHMLLGFALDADGRRWAYLETTQLGLLQAGASQNTRPAKTQMQRSFDNFEYALSLGQNQVDAAGNRFYQRDNIDYQIIDIQAARAKGIRALALDLR